MIDQETKNLRIKELYSKTQTKKISKYLIHLQNNRYAIYNSYRYNIYILHRPEI